MIAYDYKLQRWVEGDKARRELIRQAIDTIRAIKGDWYYIEADGPIDKDKAIEDLKKQIKEHYEQRH